MTPNLPGFFQGTEMPTAGWWEALWPDPASVLAAVGIAPKKDVIDLCSDDGWFTLQIAKIAAHVTAIDIDPNLLEVARHRLTEAGVNNCDFSDCKKMPRFCRRPDIARLSSLLEVGITAACISRISYPHEPIVN